VSRILDVSFNRVHEIKGLGQLHKLEKLFLCANKISRIENLNHLKNLTLLELGDNKIRASRSPVSDLALRTWVFNSFIKLFTLHYLHLDMVFGS
jgi:hypothetical protein